MFQVGQKVVRINVKSSYNERNKTDEPWPKSIAVGGIYTVRDVDTRAGAFGWPIVLRFEEFRAKECHVKGIGPWEPGFPGDCFRPVVDPKTDINFAHEILRKVNRKNKVQA